ncbi:MAG: hypothetical protein Q8K87_04335 [Hydrogenophaga sp.]|jgi:hypothetical protein|nr:hypothetical protein [Hydrogenophaga sp.]MDP1893351.1 hypothetical protein [Hydrogenophaga sp.]
MQAVDLKRHTTNCLFNRQIQKDPLTIETPRPMMSVITFWEPVPHDGEQRSKSNDDPVSAKPSATSGICLFTVLKLSLHSLDKAVHNLPQVLYDASKSLILKEK